MNVLDEARKRPVMSGITLVGAAGAILLFMNVMPGLEMIVSIKKAPEVAQAAMQKAIEAKEDAKQSREWIDAYIEQQKQQQELEKQRYELEQDFSKQLLDLQRQQQQPSQMQTIPNLPVPPPTPIRVYWEKTEDGEWFCTDGRESWWPNEDTGACE